MKPVSLITGACLTFAISVFYCPSASAALVNDDDMFEFVRAELDRTSVAVRKRTIAKAKPGKRPTTTGPNNFYLHAQMKVGKAMAIARGMRRSYNDRMIRDIALAAFRNNRIPEALSAVGVGLYNDYKRRTACKKMPRSSCKAHTGIIEQLRAVLGDDKFDEFMSVNGDATLVFVVDTTLSMGGEIKAAIKIIQEIANYPRQVNVDYILSPFNDPQTGPVYGKQDNRAKFLDKVRKLSVYGGFDCEELAFHGIIDAIEKGKPRVASPMYVFTDAGPKDTNFNDRYNEENAGGLVIDYEMPVNFFFSQSSGGCKKPQTFKPFTTLVEDSGGVGIFFSDANKISLMGDIVKASLDGMTIIKTGGHPSHRRVTSHSYRIPVDETINKLIIVLTVQTKPDLVQLQDSRNTVIPQTHQLALGAIWVINSPRDGSWTLRVPNMVGSHSFKVTSSSSLNIDFDHYFVWPLPGNRHIEYPISQPLLNQAATVKLLIPTKDKVNVNSLSLEIVHAKYGSLISQARLSGITATFIPPATPFKLRLKGRTVRGLLFERTSRKVIKAQSTVIRMLFNRNYLLLRKGRRSAVRFALHNVGPTDRFKVILKTSVPGVSIMDLRPDTYRISKGRRRYFTARITLSTSLRQGQVVPLMVSATQVSSNKITSKLRMNFIVANNRK